MSSLIGRPRRFRRNNAIAGCCMGLVTLGLSIACSSHDRTGELEGRGDSSGAEGHSPGTAGTGGFSIDGGLGGSVGGAGSGSTQSPLYDYCSDPDVYKLQYDIKGSLNLAETLQNEEAALSPLQGFALVLVNGTALAEADLQTIAAIRTPTAQGGVGLTSLESLGLCNLTTLHTTAFANLGDGWLRYLYLDSLETVEPNSFLGTDRGPTTSLHGVSLNAATTIGDSAFGYGSLKSLVLPSAVTIEASAFRDNHQLLEVNLPKATSLGDFAFDDCTHLLKATFPEVLTVGRNAFDDNHELSQIDLPKATYIGKNVFGSCFALTQIDFPSALKIDDNAFDNCEHLAAVNLPEVVEIRNFAFTKCVSLKSLRLPKAKYLYHEVFNQCTEAIQPMPNACCALEEVRLPEAEQLGWYVFGGCANLKVVEAPKVKLLNHHAFSGNTSLTKLVLPGLEDLREAAFEGTSSLASVVLGVTPPSMASAANNAFGGTRSDLNVYHSGSASAWTSFVLDGNPTAQLVDCATVDAKVCAP